MDVLGVLYQPGWFPGIPQTRLLTILTIEMQQEHFANGGESCVGRTRRLFQFRMLVDQLPERVLVTN